MNKRKYELMESFLKGETTVSDLIDHIVEVEKMVLNAVNQEYSVDEYVIGDRYDAAEILKELNNIATKYASVSVADYYELIGISPTYVDNAHGWSLDSINKTFMRKACGGYIIKFPPVEVI